MILIYNFDVKYQNTPLNNKIIDCYRVVLQSLRVYILSDLIYKRRSYSTEPYSPLPAKFALRPDKPPAVTTYKRCFSKSVL